MVEIFRYPELLTIFVNDSINTLAVVLCNVFGLRGHRARPLFERGRYPYRSMEHATLMRFGNPMKISEKSIASRNTSVDA